MLYVKITMKLRSWMKNPYTSVLEEQNTYQNYFSCSSLTLYPDPVTLSNKKLCIISVWLTQTDFRAGVAYEN